MDTEKSTDNQENKPTQLEMLKQELHPNNVMSRSIGHGKNLAYISGEYTIRAANGIFGFGNWSHRVRNLKEVSNTEGKGKNDKTRFDSSYIAIVAITATMEDGKIAEYEDVGYGSGISYVDIGTAIESASKEAITDAMKRALRHFGSQFGNSLYNEKFRKIISKARSDLNI